MIQILPKSFSFQRLFMTAALAPLTFVAMPSWAATTFSGNTTGPIQTATANGGNPDDIIINSGVTVSRSDSGADTNPNAIVIGNSSNVITNSGGVSSNNANNMVGILLKGGFTGGLTHYGSLSLGSSYTPTANGDGYSQGPFAGTAASGVANATGVYGLYGIQVVGPGTYAGSIINASGSSISLTGNQSYGFSIETPVSGSITQAGTISLVGDNGIGLRSLSGADISGSLTISGAIAAKGSNSSAVSLAGNIGGALDIYSSISATGYSLTTRTTNPTLLGELQTPSNNQINLSGPTAVIGGNVTGGIYIGGAPSGTASGSTVDLTGDGIADSTEGTGNIASYGSSPALVIGSSTNPMMIGGFVGQNGVTTDNGYGLIIRGVVAGSGVYDGFAAKALEIGTAAGNSVTLGSQGARVYGTVSALSYSADATAVHVYPNVTANNFDVFGTVSAGINASTTAVTATAFKLDSGASVSNLNVTGTLSAAVKGDIASAYAVSDASGNLTSVTNQGIISATKVLNALGDSTGTSQVVALDLSHNTTGITLTQTINPNPNHAYGDQSGNNHTTTTSFTAVTPEIVGDVILGSGANTVDLEAGGLTGNLNMGSGTGGTLTLNGGASFVGGFGFSGSGLAINVANGTFNNKATGTFQINSLTVGSSSGFYFAADPKAGAASFFNATGPITIASGAKLGLNLVSLPNFTNQTFTLLTSPNLNIASTDLSLSDGVPFLSSATLSQQNGNLTLDIRAKTAAEMGLNKSEATLLPIVYQIAPNDPELQSVLLSKTDRGSFLRVYDELLPESSGGVFAAVREASEAVSRATATSDQIPGTPGVKAFWGQEFVIGAHGDRSSNNIAYDVGGFGFVGGAAIGGSGFGALGVTAAFASSNVTNPLIKGDSQQAVSSFEGGLYWQGSYHAWSFDGRAAVAGLVINGRRQLYAIASDNTVAINRHVKDYRTGYAVTLHGGMAYNWNLGSDYYLRPQLRFDYFGMEEGRFTENDPLGQGFALAVNSRSGSSGSTEADLVFGRNFGLDFRVRPEIEIGAREVFSGDPGKTTARFVSGGPGFTLSPTDITGLGGVARVGLKVATHFYEIGLQASTEVRDHYESLDARVNFKLFF